MVMDTAIELTGAERGFLLLADDGGALRTAVARNLAPAEAEALRAVDADPSRSSLIEAPWSRTIAERAFHAGEAVLSNDPSADPRFAEARSVLAPRLQSVLCLPVRGRGQPAGALYLESRLRRAPFADDDLQLLQAFADQIAILLETTRLLEDNARRAAELERTQAEVAALLAERTEALAVRTEELAATRRELDAARRRAGDADGAFGLIGRSPAMERVYQLVERLSATNVPVLLLGESGTGKELVARALHDHGPRRAAPLVSVNCGALPETLLESELFGHVRGAFTGADRDRRGLFETASGGTLLLDEIGDTPARMQATLLRALQEGRIRRVGGGDDIPVDVRVVAATHRDLDRMVAAGEFRQDLYYRLHVVPVHIPALRERAEDIPLLAAHFLARAAERTGGGKKSITRRAMRRLMELPWPGNVRQLEHAITNAAVMSDGELLDEEDFAAVLTGRGAVRAGPAVDPASRHERERAQILGALEQCGWNKTRAARLLQMPRRTFYRRLADHGIR
jgi:transcriptional regulator with GAF, ATPase, and Fis domain